MKRALCTAATLVPCVIPSSLFAQKMSDLTGRLASASQVVREIKGTPDGGVPTFIISKADRIAVIPSIRKGTLIVEASHGQGVVTCRTPQGWRAPVFIRLAGASFGFQIGGQATDLVLAQ